MPINIYRGKIKRFSCFISAIGLVILSLFGFWIMAVVLLAFGLSGEDDLFNFMLLLSIAMILLWVYTCFKIFKQFFQNKIVLVLTAEGFINKLQNYSKNEPFVYWSDVASISMRKILLLAFICIDLEDEEGYLKSISRAKRRGVRKGIARGNPAIVFPVNGLKKYSAQEIYELFDTYWTQYGNKTKIV